MDGQQLIYHFHWLNNNATIVQIENAAAHTRKHTNTHTWNDSSQEKRLLAVDADAIIKLCPILPIGSINCCGFLSKWLEMWCDASTTIPLLAQCFASTLLSFCRFGSFVTSVHVFFSCYFFFSLSRLSPHKCLRWKWFRQSESSV